MAAGVPIRGSFRHGIHRIASIMSWTLCGGCFSGPVTVGDPRLDTGSDLSPSADAPSEPLNGVNCDDPKLDRSRDCAEIDGEPCGYPGGHYGYELSQVVPNFAIVDCEGEDVEFARMLNLRPDTGRCNRSVVIGLSAIWCVPCRDQAQLFAELAPDLREKGVEFIEIIYQDIDGNPATLDDCNTWDTNEVGGVFPVFFDPTDTLDDAMLLGTVVLVLPIHLTVDANGNIRGRGASAVTRNMILVEINDVLVHPYGIP